VVFLKDPCLQKAEGRLMEWGVLTPFQPFLTRVLGAAYERQGSLGLLWGR